VTLTSLLLRRRRPRVSYRYFEIVSVFAKYGLAELVSARSMLRRLSEKLGKTDEAPELVRLSFGEKLRRAAVDLGPTFIKFGQLLSDRKDIIPKEILDALKLLQDRVPPFAADEAKAIVERELRAPVDRLFLRFESVPEAAASLAQVHRAILPTGKAVAVKIKRPGIERQIEGDIAIMHQLAHFIDRNLDILGVISATEMVEEFEKQIDEELDFNHEFLNIEKFRDDFSDDQTVVIPEPFEEYSTRNVLTLEFIHAKRVSDVIAGNGDHYDGKLLNRRNTDFVVRQLFVNGFFHGDPHQGNVLVLEDNRICYIDFGMVFALRPYEVEHLNYLVIGLARLDAYLVGRSLLRMGHVEDVIDKDKFQGAVHEYIEYYLDKPTKYIDVSAAFVDLLQLVVDFGIHLPPRLVYVAKVIGMLQSIAEGLDPEFKLLEHLQSTSALLWSSQLGSRRTANKLLVSALDWGDALLELPGTFRALRQLVTDRKFDIHMPDISGMRKTIDRVGFRMVFALILSSVLISSSLVVLSGVGPAWHGIPIVGLVGFGLGTLMGVVFLFLGVITMFRWRKRG